MENHELSGELEQVHVRSKKRRSLRLEWVAALGMALAMPVLPAAAANEPAAASVATHTTLNVETRDQGGRMQATAAVTVTGADGLPAGGAVNIEDGARLLAEVKLDSSGQSNVVVELPGGSHSLRAVYTGDATHLASSSTPFAVDSDSGSTPNFQVSLAAVPPTTLPMSLTPGDSGTVQLTITPENNAALTAPMFVTLSCSGLPNESSCSFTPESVEILQNTPSSCPSGSPASACPPTSLMVLQTQRQGTASKLVLPAGSGRGSSPIAWAFLLPGTLGLGGLAWGSRRRRWLQRLFLMALLGLVTTLGTTACNPLYYYRNHGPPTTPATPAGTFTVIVTAQSTNGVTAITNSTTMVVTVN